MKVRVTFEANYPEAMRETFEALTSFSSRVELADMQDALDLADADSFVVEKVEFP